MKHVVTHVTIFKKNWNLTIILDPQNICQICGAMATLTPHYYFSGGFQVVMIRISILTKITSQILHVLVCE